MCWAKGKHRLQSSDKVDFEIKTLFKTNKNVKSTIQSKAIIVMTFIY